MDIKFSNFKCFAGEHSVKVAPLTLIYGQNSAGKSTLLQLLKLAYCQEPTTNLSGYQMDRFFWLAAGSGTSVTELIEKVQGANHAQPELSGALRPNHLGDGIELAANYKTEQNIRIEMPNENDFWWDSGALGTNALGTVALEWKFLNSEFFEELGWDDFEIKEDWWPAALELDLLRFGDQNTDSTMIRGKAFFGLNKSSLENWAPYLEPDETEIFNTSYEFEVKDIHRLLMYCLGENGYHDLTTIEIFGDDAYSGESFETLFPNQPWLWDKDLENFTHLDNYDPETDKYRNQWQKLVEWKLGLPALEQAFDVADISFSNFGRKQAVEVVKKFSQLYKDNSDIKILLGSSWMVFGVDDPLMVTTIETLLTAYLTPYIPWHRGALYGGGDPTEKESEGVYRRIEEFLRPDEKGRRMGLEISSLRPQIPESVEVLVSGQEFTIDDDPAVYLNWICNEKSKGRSDYKMAQAVRKINEAFTRLDVPHELFMKKISNDDSSDANRLEIRFKDLRNKTKVLPMHVGTGTSQMLPIIAACELRKDFVPIIIQQPELHLHPKLQANLGEYLYEKRNLDHGEYSPILIETHSELLILRILKLIKEGKADPSEVAVNYIVNTEDGPSITELRIGKDGEFIDEWPAGFFEEQGDELFN